MAEPNTPLRGASRLDDDSVLNDLTKDGLKYYFRDLQDKLQGPKGASYLAWLSTESASLIRASYPHYCKGRTPEQAVLAGRLERGEVDSTPSPKSSQHESSQSSAPRRHSSASERPRHASKREVDLTELARIHRSLLEAGGHAELDKLMCRPDWKVIRRRYIAEHGVTPEHTVVNRRVPETDWQIDLALAKAIGLDEVPETGFKHQIDDIWKDADKRHAFFDRLREIRVEHRDTVQKFFKSNRKVKRYFDLYLEDGGAESDSEGYTTGRWGEPRRVDGKARGSVLTKGQAERLKSTGKFTGRGRQTVYVGTTSIATKLALATGLRADMVMHLLTGNARNVGRTQRAQIWNALFSECDTATILRVAASLKPHPDAALEFWNGLSSHIQRYAPQHGATLAQVRVALGIKS